MKNRIFFTFIQCIHSSVTFIIVTGVIILNILDSKLKFSEKVKFSFTLVEMDTNPDRQALDADRVLDPQR